MLTIKKLLLCILVLGFLSSTFSQSTNFKPGFIIDKNQDTIRGLIKADLKTLFRKCTFRSDNSSEATGYAPAEIISFSFDEGKFYTSKEITVNGSKKIVFLEFLLKGRVNVYYYHDELGNHYYIEKDNNTLVELTEPIEKINIEGTTYEKPQRYKNKLKYLLSDCQDINSEIDKTYLSHSSLIRLAKDYHQRTCTTEECIVFEQKKKPVHVDFSVFTGYHVNTIKFGYQLPSDMQSGFQGGFRMEIFNLHKWTNRISYTVDVNVRKFSSYTFTESKYDRIFYYDKYIFLDYFYAPSTLKVDLNMWAVNVPISMKYVIISGKVSPYVAVGFNNTLVLSYNKNFILERFVMEHHKTVPDYHLGALGTTGLMINLGKKHKAFAEFSYEYNQSSNVSPTTRFMTILYGMKAGYIF